MCKDFDSLYQELLSRCNSFTIDEQNIHCLAVEVYKVANGLSTGEFENLLNFKDQYTLHVPSVNTELKGKTQLGILVQ